MKRTPFSTSNLEPLVALFLFLLVSCGGQAENTRSVLPTDKPFMVVLGIGQDAGYPQAGQQKEWDLVRSRQASLQHAVALGLVDPVSKQRWLFEATPDFNIQLSKMDQFSTTENYPYDGIFMTHGHIGHYTGLMHLGREAMGTTNVPVYAMPGMKKFLSTNGPWSQLVSLNNIKLKDIANGIPTQLNERISVTPLQVPHRDEFTETVGFLIKVLDKQLLFIPDIDKWEKWDKDITTMIQQVDYALLDGSFFQNGEIPGRDMSEIPHPFVEESMKLFENLSETDKAKVHFIHFNHTNPIIFKDSEEYQKVLERGFQIASDGQLISFD
ncbi:MAG: pyrroloquinoline quinone biosynthesis protein PqqB [Roseivirga sp.]|nr:pyrroloquinoline quinone biosynthesis protein PqqB [Roseivirga sp.]